MKPSVGFHGTRAFLGLERNILVLLAAVFLLGLGEELWLSFVPKYLEALGTGVFVWISYRSLKDLLDAVYQYPGGVLAHRLGRRRAPSPSTPPTSSWGTMTANVHSRPSSKNMS